MAQHFEEIATSLLPIWDTSIPDIPPRSRLYNLPPIGLSSPLVESLTSYLCRLACEHRVTVGTLIQYTIAPIIGKQYIANCQSRGISSFMRYAGPMNGNGIMASNWVCALESLTYRPDLALLTLLVGADALSQRDLLQPDRRWCPMCYDIWRRRGASIYEPLLWSINGITVCPEHRRPLERCCSHCSSALPLLTWCSRPGYCSACGKWLGKADGNGQAEEREIYIAVTVGSFLAHMSQLPLAVSRECVIQALRDLIAVVSEGNVAAFARKLGLPKTTIWELVQGHYPPSLPFLLDLCYQFHLSPLRFLTSGERAAPVESHEPLKQSHKHDVHRSFNREKVQQALEDILADQQRASLSMQGAAQLLGYPVRTITAHFPQYCREISRRYADYRTQQGRLRKAHLRQRICESAHALHSQRLPLTYRRVGAELSTPGCFREPDTRRALLDIRSQLEEETASE